jgi:CheY-like chemotaxis protein
VLLYSGRNDLLDSSTATAAGVRTLLAKPVDKAALRAALQDALPATST